MKHRIGEAEVSLWHLRSELSGWQTKLDLLIQKVDHGLSHVMGQSQMLSVRPISNNSNNGLFSIKTNEG